VSLRQTHVQGVGEESSGAVSETVGRLTNLSVLVAVSVGWVHPLPVLPTPCAWASPGYFLQASPHLAAEKVLQHCPPRRSS